MTVPCEGGHVECRSTVQICIRDVGKYLRKTSQISRTYTSETVGCLIKLLWCID